MADEKNFEVIEQSYNLTISCDQKEFVQLRDKILEAIAYKPTSDFFYIEITNTEALDNRAKSTRRGDGYFLVGCGVLAFVFLFIFIVGITEIISWIG